jgi:hypothetical protein
MHETASAIRSGGSNIPTPAKLKALKDFWTKGSRFATVPCLITWLNALRAAIASSISPDVGSYALATSIFGARSACRVLQISMADFRSSPS